MAEVPANVSKAFDDLASLFGGAKDQLQGDIGDKAVEYRADIASRLSLVGSKLSPNFLGDFFETTRNSSPAAEPPESAKALTLPPAVAWGGGALILLGAYLLYARS